MKQATVILPPGRDHPPPPYPRPYENTKNHGRKNPSHYHDFKKPHEKGLGTQFHGTKSINPSKEMLSFVR